MPEVQGVITAANTMTNPHVITVTWNNAAFTNGASSYRVIYRISGTSSWTTEVIQGGSVTTYDIEDIEHAKIYELYVVPVGSDGKDIRKTAVLNKDTLAGPLQLIRLII